MNCRTCGKMFWSGDLLEDDQEMIRIMKERGGSYCEQHKQKVS